VEERGGEETERGAVSSVDGVRLQPCRQVPDDPFYWYGESHQEKGFHVELERHFYALYALDTAGCGVQNSAAETISLCG
jgi:hypothetical protein